MTQKTGRGKFRLKLHIILIIVVSLFFAYCIYGNLTEINTLEGKKHSAEAKLKAAQQESEKINSEIASVDSDEFIEKAARHYLGLVKPDETVFIKN